MGRRTRPAARSRVSRPRRWLGELWFDLRHVARQLRRAPAPAAFITATLAIGIGANVTMAGVIDRLLLRPPAGVREPARLIRVLSRTPSAPVPGTFVSYPTLLELQREVTAFDGVAASTRATLTLGAGPDAPEISAALVSASYFTVLGVRPALGRVFTAADGFPSGTSPGGPPLAVLSYGFWQRQFGGDSSVVGRTLRVGKLVYTVVGVAPQSFRGVDADTPDLWLPVTVAADAELQRYILENREMSWLSVVARLRPRVTRRVAGDQATAVVRRAAPPIAPYDQERVVAASVIRGRGPDAPREVKVALWLGGISALVLLIACANVANLLLARALTRRREVAIRLTLGASRGRLARQALTEALVIAALGGAGAVGLASVGSGMLRRFFLVAGDTAGAFVDGRVFAFTAVVALGTGVLVSLAPLAQSYSSDLTRALRTGAAAGGGRRSRARTVLLGAQAALCMVLLVVAALFARSLRRVQALDLGMDPDRTLAASFNLRDALMSQSERDATYAALRERVLAIPGVARVAFVDGGRAVNVHTKARNTDEEVRRTWDVPYEYAVDSGYFRMLGTSLRGRDFASGDVRGAPRATIINEPLADLLFPGGDALGRCVYLPVRATDPDGDCWTVVGVLRGFWYARSILKREGLLVYVPLAQRSYGLGRPGQMVVSVNGSPAAIIPSVREAILRVRPDLPRVRVRWMRDVVEPEVRPWRLGAAMFSLFGIVALVIAAVGLCAVVAFTAAQRSSEIAVRVALGARARNVLSVVAGDGLRAVLVGLGVGVLAALAMRRWVGPLLFQTSPSDPGIILGAAGLLLTVAAMATIVPTARSLRRSPATVLRED